MVAPLVVYGGDAQNEDARPASYIGTTLRNVTIDGWIIIVILAVLFFMSLAIMIAKFAFLNRVARATAPSSRNSARWPTTRRRWNARAARRATAATMLSRRAAKPRCRRSSRRKIPASFGISTLWRLYHHGMRETMKRLEGQAAGADRVKTLSAQSIEAIRATLDASLTRMTSSSRARWCGSRSPSPVARSSGCWAP